MGYTQDTRICTIQTPLGANVLLVERFSASEAISRLFQCEIDLVSTKGTIDPKDIVGKPVSVEIKLEDESSRVFHGIVSRFGQGGIVSHVSQTDTERRLVAHRAIVVPKLWLLTRTSDCRIFQDQSAVDIIQTMLNEKGVTDVDVRATGGRKQRTYCVQYRETAFNFVSRLMEEEGISYFFEHHKDRHMLVLADQSSHAQLCISRAVEYATTIDANEQAGEIEDWFVERELQPGKYALTDYNFETPSTSLLAQTSTVAEIGENTKYELYDHPTEHQTMGDGEQRAKRRMEAEEAAAQRAQGRGAVAPFYAGARFKLTGHHFQGFNGEYVLTSVQHSVSQGVGHEGSGEGGSYVNSFSCLPSKVQLRPAFATPRPVIQGIQTAVVTGPAGEEIYVDKYGRVKVQFHWDREGKKDEKSSCWMRVSQAIAGKQWGAVYLPRIGQEVIVEFIEGDPDRPLVTGRVYNAEQMPPYELPANKTQSGMKSRSSIGGGGFNEIRLEDKKGNEELFIHAQKDEMIVVLHDKSESIGNNESISVGTNRTENVGKDENITIGNDRVESVGRDETISIVQNRSLEVGKNESLSVGSDQSITVGKDTRTDVAGKRVTEIAKDDELNVGKKFALIAGDQIQFQTGSASITMKKDGTIEIKGKDIKIVGSGKVSVKASSDVTIKGSKINQN